MTSALFNYWYLVLLAVAVAIVVAWRLLKEPAPDPVVHQLTYFNVDDMDESACPPGSST